MQDIICGLYNKNFRIVIYDRNDTTIVEPVLQNYKTTIVDYNRS